MPIVPFLVAAAPFAFTPQEVQLSEPLAQWITGDVLDFALDGAGVVVFRGDAAEEGSDELFRARLDGSLVQQRLPAAAPAFDVESEVLSPDGEFVAFAAGGRLYGQRADASAPPVLLHAAGNLRTFVIAPGSNRVLFNLDLRQLYSVPITGGVPLLLAEAAENEFLGGDLTVTPGGARIVYRVQVSGRFELQSQLISGGDLRVHASNGAVHDYRLSADGSRFLYRADPAITRVELFSVSFDGSVPVRLSPPLPRAGTVEGDHRFSADLSLAVFRVQPGSGGDPDVQSELWAAPIDGSAPAVKLNDPLVATGDVFDFALAGDAVVYRATGAAPTIVELFRVPLDRSSAPLSLSAPMTAGMRVSSCAVAPDGARVAFVANREDATRTRLWSVPVTGGTPLALDPARELAEDASLVFSPDSAQVLYTGEEGPHERLLAARLDGAAAPRALSATGALATDIGAFALEPASGTVAYLSDEVERGTIELHSVPLDGSRPSLRLSRASDVRTWTDSIARFAATPDGRSAVYVTGNYDELWSTSLDAPHARPRGPVGAPGFTLVELALSSDSRRVVYTARDSSDPVAHLYSAPLDGPGLARRIDAAPVTGAVRGIAIDPTSAHVFFLSEAGTAAVQLFRVPIAGGAAPTVVNGPIVIGPTGAGHVRAFVLTPDGQEVVYRADQEKVGAFALYSAPAAGGSFVRLNGELGVGEDVSDARLLPDGNVLYLSDEVLNGVENLYTVPRDGSAAPIDLSGHLAGAHVVRSHQLTSDGTRVVYAVQLPDASVELRVVPLDGSAAPLTLAATLDADDLLPTPDGTRVLFLSEHATSGRVELWSVPLDASAPATKLSASTTSVSLPRLTPDGTHVVYLAFGLHVAPVDGSTAAVERLLGGPRAFDFAWDGRLLCASDTTLFDLGQPTGASRTPVATLDPAASFQLTSDGRRVLYPRNELYLRFLTRPHRPR